MRGRTPIDTFDWIYGPTPGNHCPLLRTQELLASCSYQWLERVVALHREGVTLTCRHAKPATEHHLQGSSLAGWASIYVDENICIYLGSCSMKVCNKVLKLIILIELRMRNHMRLDCLWKSEHPLRIRISYSTAPFQRTIAEVLSEQQCEQRVCAMKAIKSYCARLMIFCHTCCGSSAEADQGTTLEPRLCYRRTKRFQPLRGSERTSAIRFIMITIILGGIAQTMGLRLTAFSIRSSSSLTPASRDTVGRADGHLDLPFSVTRKVSIAQAGSISGVSSCG